MHEYDNGQSGQPPTLAEIFTREEPPVKAPQPRKRYVYRSYYAGECQNPDCGEDLGLVETEGGRDRHYCSDKCRVAHYRKRKREAQREQVLRYNSELRDYWRERGIRGEVLARLQEILLQHGKKAARAATDAVLVALAAAEQAGSQEQFTLMDEIMLGGESIGFPEIKHEDFRIAAGVQGWTDFVSHTTITFLRQMRGYLYDLQQQELQKAQARKRLEALSRNVPSPAPGGFTL